MQIAGLIKLLRQVVAALDFDSLTGAEAAAVVTQLAEGERLCGAAKLRGAARVAMTRGYEVSGHRDGVSWLSSVSKESPGAARVMLALGEQMARSEELAGAFSRGELSVAEAKLVSRATALDPSAAPSLLEEARRGDFVGLRAAASAVERKALGEAGQVALERRAHDRRFCRFSTPEAGGLRLEALFSRAEGSRVLAAVEKAAKELCGKDRSLDQARADALVGLVRSAGGSGRRGPSARVIVRVDATTLRRGYVEGEELCEIDGVGSVPVAGAKALLGDALLSFVVRKGEDIATVTSWTRVIPRRVETALIDRDRCCVVPGCHATRFLQVDHWQTDYSWHGPTELANLCRLCSAHHAMKSHGDYELTGGPGNWGWRPTRQFWRRQHREKERVRASREPLAGRPVLPRPVPTSRTG